PTRWLAIPDELDEHVARQRSAVPRARTLSRLSDELRAAIAAEDEEAYHPLIARRPPFWYASLVVPLLRAMLDGAPFRGVLGLPNRGRLPGRPDDLVVESLGSTTDHDPAAV